MSPHAQILQAHEGEWLSFHGIPVRIVAGSEVTGGTFMASVGRSIAGGETPPHSHSFDEGFYLLEGEMTFRAGNERVTLQAGDFVQIPAGVAHQPINESGAEARLLTVCAPAGFDGFQRDVSEPMAGPEAKASEAGSDANQRMETAAKKYGIRFDVTEADFSKPACITVTRRGEGRVIAAVGDVYRFLAAAENTNGRYAIWHASIHPGGGPPPHIHRLEEEFFYILQGELSVFNDGEKFTVGPDGAITLERGTRHWFKNETNSIIEALIMVAPAGLEKMFEQSGEAWEVLAAAPPKPTNEQKQKLGEIAPQYGIELG